MTIYSPSWFYKPLWFTWNSKGDILKHAPALLLHAIAMNGKTKAFKRQKRYGGRKEGMFGTTLWRHLYGLTLISALLDLYCIILCWVIEALKALCSLTYYIISCLLPFISKAHISHNNTHNTSEWKNPLKVVCIWNLGKLNQQVTNFKINRLRFSHRYYYIYKFLEKIAFRLVVI